MRNSVELTFNEHQKEFFNKTRPGDNVKALCPYKKLSNDHAYGNVWKKTIKFSGCVSLEN
ncbi:hypothetical protein [Elusimicrobium posterum]|uniref:hypothetical protein n=1 Tax=Elusimicrobium posterum TaxID=3116653 RepID=UPI003C72EC68